MARKNPTPTQKERLFKANTIDKNIAIICAKNNDAHHNKILY